ncbi:magnesium transporter MRS2-4 isoform X1 [Carica papaya]|uniref:magnesium transporter MRS2-4 isoform X1 n=1 Tax=Carica papaya TaxID=3649 RepID=UPI000B8C81FE|nr:magnesium transporter MRS2-4 isoform X1 [Carica papaya]XP_021900232.1 magnesium transporter MRS2-4 isoform X1 [Carica papaya]XP_021900233.1 magnesium transporter MRS2-4 isoform X1 [Carica papaya]XP_021900234.1 magnesium transporter MRS2-4 isoform X1 [Carica papaya]
MVVNLEFIKAIVTAEEVLLLDPLRQEVLPFVDQLRQQLPHKGAFKIHGTGPPDVHDSEMHVSPGGQWLPVPEVVEGLQCELPFEFQVLEIALEVVCTYLDTNVADLERDAYPVLDELARNVSTKNLEHVRSLKSNLTRLLARVQKVRDEIEHLLDDNEDMGQLYLTRKWMQNQQSEAVLGASASNAIVPTVSSPNRTASLVTSNLDNNDVEDLEMLLEAYFMQLDGTRNKILSNGVLGELGKEKKEVQKDLGKGCHASSMHGWRVFAAWVGVGWARGLGQLVARVSLPCAQGFGRAPKLFRTCAWAAHVPCCLRTCMCTLWHADAAARMPCGCFTRATIPQVSFSAQVTKVGHMRGMCFPWVFWA